MARLNQERQNELEPKRMAYAMHKLTELGFKVTQGSDKELHFAFKGNTIRLFPYSGWFSGGGIEDGRGIKNLIDQIKE